MPNWVYNSIKGWSKELHDKYKSEGRDIDFDKVIPMPEEIKDSISCGYNEPAKRISEYTEFKERMRQEHSDDKDFNTALRVRYGNPIKDDVMKFDQKVAVDIGHLCISNPDESLNNLLEKKENSGYKYQHGRYAKVFGKSSYNNIKAEDSDTMFSNYIDLIDEDFKRFQSSKDDTGISSIKKYKNIEEYGKHLREVGAKYGYDNWYDWSCANWGTKWNACDTNYDEEKEQLCFDTAWSIPYPVLAKVAQQNPKAKMEGYSEEETGWFDEYSIKGKKVFVNAYGEINYDRETGEQTVHKEVLKPRPVIYFDKDGELKGIKKP